MNIKLFLEAIIKFVLGVVIIGLLIFGHFFGIVAMLLSSPIIGVCKVIIKYFDLDRDYEKIENDIIVDAKFKTFGCVAAIVSTDLACDKIKGLTGQKKCIKIV